MNNSCIQDAIKAGSFTSHYDCSFGDPEKSFHDSYRFIEGESYLGGQEHFYLEPHCGLIVPKECGELEMTM